MKTVAIVGGGPSRKQAPWSDYSIDIWLMNEAASKSGNRANAVFQMHDKGIWSNPNNINDPGHYAWLQGIHGVDVWMQNTDPEVPESKCYPLEEAKKLTEKVLQKGKNDRELKPIELFTFTGTYMIALAILLGYRRILIYGIDLINTEEYRYQRESFMFWVGFAGGRGVELEIYGGDDLWKRPLYGYETFKEFKIVNLTNLERIRLLEILPQKGSLVTMGIVAEMQKELNFSSEEIEKWKIREVPPGESDPIRNEKNNTQFMWIRWEDDPGKEIEIGEIQRKVALAAFAELDKKESFTTELMELYRKFTYE